ncbi:hypothetical protein BH11CYA1_BH11CYA1_35820 [soil metagenome]
MNSFINFRQVSRSVTALTLLLCGLPAYAQGASTSGPGALTAPANNASPSSAPPVIAAPSVASAAGGLNKPVRDKWALIVGIGEFTSDKIPKLKYATKDARDFYSYLTKEANFAPDHVRILLDGKATQRRIMSELGSKFLARLARPDDMIVLFFSTHGSPSQMDLRGRNYLVAADSDPEDLFATGIEMQKVLESIQSRVLSDRVLLVMDACHSGSVGGDGKGVSRTGNFDAEVLAEGSGQMVICSSKPDEQSWESKRYQNGVFTKNLLEGLRSGGSMTSISKAFDAAQSSIQNEVKEDHPGARQTPVMHSKWSGNEMLLAIKPSAPERIPPTVFEELDLDSTDLANGTAVAAKPTAKPITKPVSNPESGSETGKGSEDFAPSRSGSRANTASYAPRYSADGADSVDSDKKLILTKTYFSNDPTPEKSYQYACEASGANFNNTDLYYRKAALLIQMGKYGKAMQQLSDVLVDDPNNEHYRLARAFCYAKQGMRALAAEDIRTAQFKNPKLPTKIEIGD